MAQLAGQRDGTCCVAGRFGLRPADPLEWTGFLQPGVALVSVTPGDRDGLPNVETLEALQGTILLRTDRNGWIEISTDVEQMWVEVERR